MLIDKKGGEIFSFFVNAYQSLSLSKKFILFCIYPLNSIS